MKFLVKRLFPDHPDMTGYHLFAGDGALVMVAEHGTPWQPASDSHLLRFAYPNGQALASMDLSGQPTSSKHGLRRVSYAVIYDMAVYAIITEFQPETAVAAAELPHFVLEVDGFQWVMVGEQHENLRYVLFAEVNSDPTVYESLLDDPLTTPLGQIEPLEMGHDLVVTLPDDTLRQPAIVALALVFLADRNGRLTPSPA